MIDFYIFYSNFTGAIDINLIINLYGGKMGKILTTALILGSLYGVANAVEIKPYVGLDVAYNSMDTKDIKDLDTNFYFNIKNKSNKANFGLNAGAKFDFSNNMFLNTELYYRMGKLVDLSGNFQEDYAGYRTIEKEEFEVENNFGAKLYFGYEFNDKLNAFISFGLNRMEMEYKFSTNDIEISSGDLLYSAFAKYTNKKFVPSYGFGVAYNFTKNIEARLSYEFINYKTDFKYVNNNYDIEKSSINLNTHSFRLGVNYLF